jgi:hypothetical protein
MEDCYEGPRPGSREQAPSNRSLDPTSPFYGVMTAAQEQAQARDIAQANVRAIRGGAGCDVANTKTAHPSIRGQVIDRLTRLEQRFQREAGEYHKVLNLLNAHPELEEMFDALNNLGLTR